MEPLLLNSQENDPICTERLFMQDQQPPFFFASNSDSQILKYIFSSQSIQNNKALNQAIQHRKIPKIPYSENKIIKSYIKTKKNSQQNLKIFPKSQRKLHPKRLPLCSDYEKNIPVHIFNRAARIMFRKDFDEVLLYQCQKQKIDIDKFRKYYQELLSNKVCSLKNIVPFFYPERNQDMIDFKMFKVFDQLICKILRKTYTLETLSQSRSKNKAAYVKVRNTFLLYLSDYIGQ